MLTISDVKVLIEVTEMTAQAEGKAIPDNPCVASLLRALMRSGCSSNVAGARARAVEAPARELTLASSLLATRSARSVFNKTKDYVSTFARFPDPEIAQQARRCARRSPPAPSAPCLDRSS